MLNAQQKNILGWLVIVLIVAQPASVMLNVFGMENPLGTAWIEFFTVPEDDEDEDVRYAKLDLDIIKKGTSTAITGTGYVWYDWNNNGVKDYGDKASGEGEIEEVPFTSGAFTTGVRYPVGNDKDGLPYTIYLQFPITDVTGYQTRELSLNIPSSYISGDWNPGDAIDMGDVFLIATEDTFTVTVSEADAGVLVTSSTDYNYTTNGLDAEMTISITCSTDDKGIFQNDWTHWKTQKAYKGSFIGITMDVADSGNCVFGDITGSDDQGSYSYAWWDLTAMLFNDAGISDDGKIRLDFDVTIAGAFDWNTIGIYDYMLMSSFNQQAWGTPDGSETDIDFVA